MEKVLYVGLDVHKESIVVATAPQGDTEAQLYGKIGGTLEALINSSKGWRSRIWSCGLSMKRGRAVTSFIGT
jgi:hypothetical protein